MKKKNIKIVKKDYELKKKLESLKEKLEEDIDDGKILAKITAGCAITTIIALLTTIVGAVIIGGLPSVFAIISFGMLGFTLIEGLVSMIFHSFGWSDKILNGIKNKIINSKIKKVERTLSKLNEAMQDKDFNKVLRVEVDEAKLEDEIKFQKEEIKRKELLIKKLALSKKQAKQEQLKTLEEKNKKLDNEIKSFNKDEISVEIC